MILKIIGGKNMNELKRVGKYILGLFIITIGVGFSIKSNLGNSPISTIPYSLTLVFGIDMGLTTIIFFTSLVILVIILLGREFKLKSLLQIVSGVIFGYFTNCSLYLMSFIPVSNSFIMSIIYMGISIFCIALGIFFYLPPNIIPLAVEGATQTISRVINKPFPKVKVVFDMTMVTISGLICLINIDSLGSVGIGTIISAFSIGFVLNYIVKFHKKITGHSVNLKQTPSSE